MNRPTGPRPAQQAVLVLAPPRFLGPLGVMRSLSRLGIRVYGLASREPSIAGASRMCAGQLAAGRDGRPVGVPEAVVVGELLAVGRRLGEGTILLAGSDEWALFIAAHGRELAARFVFPEVPVELIDGLTSKIGLTTLAARHGLPSPKAELPDSLDEAMAAAERLRYPVVLKPLLSRQGEESLALAADPAALRERYLAMGGPGDVLLQEYVRGDDADIWMFNGYFDRDSRCVAAFTARRIRQQPVRMGTCSAGVCAWNEEVALLASRFLAAVGYRGVVDIDFIYDRAQGKYRVLDVNPRLGGAFRLMVDPTGLDVVRAMYLDLTGRPVPAPQPADGRKWAVEASELIAFRQYRRDHGLGVRPWLGSLRGLQETATFSWSDPGPFLVAMRTLASDTFGGRRARRVGSLRRRTRLPRPSGAASGSTL